MAADLLQSVERVLFMLERLRQMKVTIESAKQSKDESIVLARELFAETKTARKEWENRPKP
jgi:hypothetical protein